MKFSKLVVMALLAAGVTFVFTGCGDKKEEAAESKKTEKSEKDEKKSGARAAADKFIKKKAKEIKEDGISNIKYVKENKVSKNYIVVCYNAKSEKKGKIKFGLHAVKKDGKWKIVEGEDHWEAKDKYKDSEDEDSKDEDSEDSEDSEDEE